MKVAPSLFSPHAAGPDSFTAMGAAMLMAHRQITSAIVTAQFRMIEDATRAVTEVQREVLDAVIQATIRRD